MFGDDRGWYGWRLQGVSMVGDGRGWYGWRWQGLVWFGDGRVSMVWRWQGLGWLEMAGVRFGEGRDKESLEDTRTITTEGG